MTTQKIEFGTDGWRAVVADDFTYENVRYVAQGVAWYLADDARPVVVGHDTRYCAEQFSREVARVLAANGHSVILVDGPIPTPGVSWTVVDRKAAGAVMVTASHNPPEFNGLKYKPDYGGSAGPEIVEQLEHHTTRAQKEGVLTMPYAEAQEKGTVTLYDAYPSYAKQIGTMVDIPGLKKAGLNILHEPMYGAGLGLVSRILEGGATKVTELHGVRNPGFGGLHPEPIDRYMDEAMATMKKGGFDLCIANDGDADRVGIIDNTGRFVNQLEVAALLSLYFLEKRGIKGPLVRSLTSTSMLDRLGEKFGVPVFETMVGFKYIGPKMMAEDAILGAEESGGFAFRGHIPERDGILAGLLVAQMVVDYGKPLSEILVYLEKMVGRHCYARHDIRLEREGYADRKKAFYAQLTSNTPTELAGSQITSSRTDDGFKFYFKDGSWVLVRFSGTEPLIRVYSEAPTKERVAELLASLEAFLKIGDRPKAGAHA